MKLLSIIKKDILLEIRSRETLISMLSLAIMMSVLSALGIQNSFLDPKAVARVFPALLWISFIFAGTVSISRSLHYEYEYHGIDGILTIGVSPWKLFISKVLINAFVTTIMYGASLFLLSGLLGIDISGKVLQLFSVGAVCSVGYASLSTLCASMTIHARVKDLLLPLILIPLLFPLFFGGHELTAQILSHSFDMSSPWVTLLLILDLIYVVVGLNLFEFAVRG